MTLEERLADTRRLCEQALAEPALMTTAAALEAAGWDDPTLADFVQRTASSGKPPGELLTARRVEIDESNKNRYPFERLALIRTALQRFESVRSLPVTESVRHIWCKEIQFAANPSVELMNRFDLAGDPFYAMCKIVTGRRFPAGHHSFEISGVPRRLLAKARWAHLPQFVKFLVVEARGFAPFFETHLTSTLYKMPVLIEREFRMSFYRMAKSLENQPDVRGIIGGSWLHSPETHRISPHLAFMNRPFEEAGGIVVELGPAKENDGFLSGSPARAELYRSGQYKPTHACGMCSREQALAWVDTQRKIGELADSVS